MPITLHTETEALPDQIELVAGRERDEFQLQIDKDVKALKMSTAKAGWPAPDPKKLFHRYVVGSDDKAALKAVIRRSGTLLHVEPRFYRDAKTEAGHIVVKFHVERKVDKNNKPVKDDDLNTDGSPKVVAQASPKVAAQAPPPKPGTK